jgi:hypothetical protein
VENHHVSQARYQGVHSWTLRGAYLACPRRAQRHLTPLDLSIVPTVGVRRQRSSDQNGPSQQGPKLDPVGLTVLWGNSNVLKYLGY